MKLSLFWVAVVAVAAYYYGRQREYNAMEQGLEAQNAAAQALKTTAHGGYPAPRADGQASAVNPAGTSAWTS